MNDRSENATRPLGDLVVHVLLAGFPLCGFSMEVPGKWPAGHLWVGEDEAEKEATCERCRAEVAR